MKQIRIQKGISKSLLLAAMLISAVATAAIAYLLVTIFEHKQDARNPYFRVVELNEVSTDPTLWGQNFPHHFDQYKSTAGDRFYGGSSALPESKLEHFPWLKRLYAGYAFSIDYREARGHAYMLYDQVVTERIHQRKQAGACLHCHASPTVLYRKTGLEALGLPTDDESLARDFNMEAVIKGFEVLSREPYHTVLEMLTQVPDGTPLGSVAPAFDTPPVEGFGDREPPAGHFQMSEALSLIHI
jgi:nitrite reductase (cytochrome c-552)